MTRYSFEYDSGCESTSGNSSFTVYEDNVGEWCKYAEVSAGIEQLRQELEAALALLEPNDMKVRVCEYLLCVNKEHEGAFIPPTAIDWLGNGIVKAARAAGGAR